MEKKEPSEAATGCGGCLGLIVIGIVLYFAFCANDSSTSSSRPRAPDFTLPPTPEEQTRPLLTLNLRRWHKDGFGAVMMADFDINNGSTHTVKDITVHCTHFAPSGTEIDANVRTIYQTFPPQRTRAVRGFNMGFIDEQAGRTRCQITDFVLVD